jgi:hypothetical protein
MQGFIGILGGIAVFVAVLFAATALVPLALAYVALRVRDARSPEPDPALGAKTAFHLIHSLGILMALAGLTISAIDLMSGEIAPKPFVPPGIPQRQPAPAKNDNGFNAAQRTAVALVGVGTLFALIFWGVLLGTNDRTHRAVRRVFVGGRMTLCLLVTMVTIAGLVVVLIQKVPDHQLTESFLAILFVWIPAAIVHVFLFKVSTREPKSQRPRSAEEEAWMSSR